MQRDNTRYARAGRVRHGRNLSERTEKIRRPKCSTPRRAKDWQ